MGVLVSGEKTSINSVRGLTKKKPAGREADGRAGPSRVVRRATYSLGMCTWPVIKYCARGNGRGEADHKPAKPLKSADALS